MGTCSATQGAQHGTVTPGGVGSGSGEVQVGGGTGIPMAASRCCVAEDNTIL